LYLSKNTTLLGSITIDGHGKINYPEKVPIPDREPTKNINIEFGKNKNMQQRIRRAKIGLENDGKTKSRRGNEKDTQRVKDGIAAQDRSGEAV